MSPIIIAVIVLALGFDFLNGIHDSSNVVATMISSRALSPRVALWMTALANFVGPFIFERQADIVADHLKDAVAKGAKILCGGQIVQKGGKWLAPTVVVDVTHKMKLMTEETFGPVIPIMPFDTVDEAVALANDTIYGLSASVYAGTPQDAVPVARRLNGGAVSINDGSLTAMVQDVAHDSFGYSGMGPSRFGPEGILRYVRRKALLTNTQGPMDVTGRVVALAG